MNVHFPLPTTPDEFLRWNESREGKRQFVNGRVVEMMTSVTRNHADLASNVIAAIRPRLDRKTFSVGSADFGVRTPAGVRYPDIFVDRRTEASQSSDLEATEPLLLAEILSPSSISRDFVDKLGEYREISSLIYHLILSHEEARVWLWSREGKDWTGPQEIEGDEGTVRLPALGIELPLADLYDGIARRG